MYSILYPDNWNEVNEFLSSFMQDSDIPRKSKLRYYSVISVKSSSK